VREAEMRQIVLAWVMVLLSVTGVEASYTVWAQVADRKGETVDWRQYKTYESLDKCEEGLIVQWKNSHTGTREAIRKGTVQNVQVGSYYISMDLTPPVEGLAYVRISFGCYRDAEAETTTVPAVATRQQEDQETIALVMSLLFKLPFMLLFGSLGWSMAAKRNKNKVGWAIGGGMFPFVLFSLWLSSPVGAASTIVEKPCPDCTAKTPGSYCSTCGTTW
jgi:hypothetical protein